MTTLVVTATETDTIQQVRRWLRAQGEHIADLNAICVIDDEGRLVDDVSMGELLLADPDAPVADLIEPPWPMTVTVEAPFSEVVNRLIDARRQSVAVVFAPGRLHRRRVGCVDPGAAFGTGLGVRPVVSDGIGAAMELLGVSRYLAVPIAAGVVWALVIFGSYRSAERVFLVLSLAFLVFRSPRCCPSGLGRGRIAAAVAPFPGLRNSCCSASR
jgi:hypothetical protein